MPTLFLENTMLRRIAALAVVMLLGGCQSNQVNHDFDASRDFGAYRNWAWKDPVPSR